MRLNIAGLTVEIPYDLLEDAQQYIEDYKKIAYPQPLPKGKGVRAEAVDIDSSGSDCFPSITVVNDICEFGEQLPLFNRFLMHGVAISCSCGKGAMAFPFGGSSSFIFTAPSGVGKSTHAFLWQRLLGKENVHIINGDKPIIQAVSNQDAPGKSDFLAWGTPWCGKEGLHENVSAPLRGIGLLHRLDQEHPAPSVCRATSEQFIDFMMDQVFLPRDPQMLRRVFDMIETLYQEVPIYHLYMDMSKEAVELSVSTLLACPH